MSELPAGWTLTHEPRVTGFEDADSAFTDGMQWTLRDPDGNRPPQAEWPTDWRGQAALYAHTVDARRRAVGDPSPPYAPGPANPEMLPRVSRQVDRMFLRKETLAALERGEQVPAGPAVVLFNRTVDDVAEIIRLCPPAKLALGAKRRPDGTVTMVGGGLGRGWGFIARHGAGHNPATGEFAESVALKLAHPDGRSALFVWARKLPDPRVMWAALVPPSTLGRHRGTRHADYMSPLWWPVLATVLAQLPSPGWKAAGSWRWTRGPDGRPNDVPRRAPSGQVKAEIRKEVADGEVHGRTTASGPAREAGPPGLVGGDVHMREAGLPDAQGGEGGAAAAGAGGARHGGPRGCPTGDVRVRDGVPHRAPGRAGAEPERRSASVRGVSVNRENAWLVVQVPWRTVVVGDVIVGKDGGLLVVQGFDRDADPVGLMTWSVKKGPWTLRTRDPERPVPVLKPEAEATALKLLGAELGAEAVCDGNESKGVEST